MSKEEEGLFLEPFSHRASAGDMATVAEIKEGLEEYVGKTLHHSVVYRCLKRNGWRRIENRTINCAIQVVRRILNLASSEWIDKNGLTGLGHAPRMTFLPETDSRKPHPLSWAEQARLHSELPAHLAKIVFLKVNTGCREAEVCGLRWEWENPVPALDTSVFVIPVEKVKNREPRLVVLNRTARSIIQEMRGVDPAFVFTYMD